MSEDDADGVRHAPSPVPEIERIRAAAAAPTYTGPEAVVDAVTLRRKVAIAAELAKRAGDHENEWMVTAREAERTLGRMLRAGREARDLMPQGRPSDIADVDFITLTDLGISRDLAADATCLARVPDNTWARWTDAARAGTTLASQAAFVRRARALIRERENARRKAGAEPDVAAMERARLDRARKRVAKARGRLEADRRALARNGSLVIHQNIVRSIRMLAAFERADPARLFDRLQLGMLTPIERRALTPDRLRETIAALTKFAAWMERQ